MADIPNAVNPAAPVTPGSGPQNPGQSAAATEQVRAETVTLPKEDYEALRRQVDWATAHIRRQLAETGHATTPAPAATNGKSAGEKAVEERVRELEKVREETAKVNCTQAITMAATTAGVTPESLEFVVDHLKSRHQLNFDWANNQVTYKNEFGQDSPILELVSNFLKGKGKGFLPAPNVGALPRTSQSPNASQQRGYLDLSQEEQMKLTPAQQLEMIRRDIEAGR